MEISNIHKTKEAVQTKKKKKIGNTTGFSKLLEETESEGTSIQEVENYEQIASLISLQETYKPESTIEQNISRGHNILNELEEFKNRLLYGDIDKNKLLKIKDNLNLIRSSTNDQNLEKIINEIELRAYVELAKYEDH